ncbi:hypothetical protein [Serratia sp. Se-RSBMAAmG]|uniref:hypothetical protein n=1 Tax=Serratia sp. Se-RSBMAAmG TaxID=3043305 RepID=UPI0024AF63F5|nr:hypothetical protein [Serratia sp. Se-RSBMAAmG]MDI6976242.1 hypothetical protein [Serratia sp. Se-RSBMAAmG]
MSKITLAIRFSDSTISTFTVHKSYEFNLFSNIFYLIDENALKEYMVNNNYPLYKSAATLLEHQDYGNDLAFLAPYTYGIVFIDFINKQVHDYNDYSGFSEVCACNIRQGMNLIFLRLFRTLDVDIADLDYVDYDFYEEAVYDSLGKNGFSEQKIFQTLNPEHAYMFNFYQAFKKDISIYYLKENETGLSERVYIEASTPSQLFKKISEMRDFTIVGMDIPGWSFFSGSSEDAETKLLPLLKKEITLSEDELTFWKEQNYIN